MYWTVRTLLTIIFLSRSTSTSTIPPTLIATPDWQVLNSSVQGRLVAAAPFSRPCFQSSDAAGGTFDEATCALIQSNFLNATFRSGVFGGYLSSQWESCQTLSQQCELNWQDPADSTAFAPPQVCQQGSVSQYYIDVGSAGDVQAAFAFSKATGVTLAIKNSGHDYKGRSSLRNSLGLWSHNLNSMSFTQSFVPQGCSAQAGTPAVTLGAGVQHTAMYEFANDHNITLPGGACPTVGPVGGFLQGGGHSWLSNIHGLAVDRVLEFEAVTPDGQHLFANACQNQDLFFALRGGGGGTFAFVLAATVKALPQTSYTTVLMTYTSNATTLEKFLSFLISNSVKWAEDGWSGQIRPGSKLVMSNANMSVSEAASYMSPLQELAETELGGNFSVISTPSYFAFYEQFVVPDAATELDGLPQTVGSRLIPAETLSSQPEALLDAMINLVNSVPISFIFANAPFSFEQDASLGPASVTPAWRNSVWHVAGGTVWALDTPVHEQKAITANITATIDPLRNITPSSGAYQNEADLHEPNFAESFWGNNYEKLVQIKRKYDPSHLLDCWQCVDWAGQSDERFSCYI